LLHLVAADVVGVLLGRALHEVGRSRQNRASDATVEGNLGRPNRVNDDSGRVGRVPDLKLVFQGQGDVSEGTTLKADTAAGQAFGFVSFDPSGTFQAATTSTVAGATAPVTATDLTGSRVTLNFANGQAQGQQLLLDFTRMTQLQDGNTVSAVENDGHPTGTLSSFTVGSNGLITGSYSNGVQEALGQIALATFANPSGLSLVSQNLMSESANSGIPQVGVPGAGSRGQINGGQLELSNVDLSVQFTDMIRAERGFQANSRIITTSDEMLQDLVNLKR
jgi:flagellar hook protein FlgE